MGEVQTDEVDDATLVRELRRQARKDEARIKELEEHLDAVSGELSDTETKCSELENKALGEDVEDAANKLLDLVERPTGSLHAALPQSPASERALIALFDAIGRKF